MVDRINAHAVSAPRHTLMLSILELSLLAFPVAASGQVDFVSARAGWIANPYSSSLEKNRWLFFPELEIGGELFTPPLSWSATWGYWTEGITEVLPIADFVTYSHSGHIVTLRIALDPQALDPHLPLPIELFAGAAGHFQEIRYVGGFDYAGRAGENSSDLSVTGLLGLGVRLRVLSQVRLEAEGVQFIPFSDSGRAQKGRRAFTLGVGLVF
jgi:hypothetical protein